MNNRILIAMSGGVDSSVAALLLQKEGYELCGMTMKLFSPEEICAPACASASDAEDARKVAEKLGIPYRICDFSEDFRESVIGDFIRTYESGGTPNPCVECNRIMKFGKLAEAGTELGCDRIATGHYARIARNGDRWLLKKAADEGKDQTYVLWTLTQEQLARTLLPLGGLRKSEVREIAEANGFCNAGRHDSQDICFVPDGDYVSFIERYTGKTFEEGDFIDLDGNVIGRHRGSIRYTIGQRKGLGIAFGKPTYVCEKDAEKNTVTLGGNEDLFRKELTARRINLIATKKIGSPIRAEGKVRYSAKAAECTVEQIEEDRIRVVFDEAQRAITKGQSVVLYDGETVIGGGIIE